MVHCHLTESRQLDMIHDFLADDVPTSRGSYHKAGGLTGRLQPPKARRKEKDTPAQVVGARRAFATEKRSALDRSVLVRCL